MKLILLHIRICIGVVHNSISLKTWPCNGSLVQTKEIWTGSQNIENKCAQEQNICMLKRSNPQPPNILIGYSSCMVHKYSHVVMSSTFTYIKLILMRLVEFKRRYDVGGWIGMIYNYYIVQYNTNPCIYYIWSKCSSVLQQHWWSVKYMV